MYHLMQLPFVCVCGNNSLSNSQAQNSVLITICRLFKVNFKYTFVYMYLNNYNTQLCWSSMAQWVKNVTAAAWVTVKAWVRSMAWDSGLKDPALPQLWCRSQLWLLFNPWTGSRCSHEKKKYVALLIDNKIKSFNVAFEMSFWEFSCGPEG